MQPPHGSAVSTTSAPFVSVRYDNSHAGGHRFESCRAHHSNQSDTHGQADHLPTAEAIEHSGALRIGSDPFGGAEIGLLNDSGLTVDAGAFDDVVNRDESRL